MTTLTIFSSMNKSVTLCLSVALVFSFFICNSANLPYADAQSLPNSTTKTTSSSQENAVTVTSSFSVGVSNQTLKTKDGMIRNAVIGFLSSGPNVLKTSPTDQPVVKTKIVNEIANATQSVEGVEATNAIIGVELSKALKVLISSTTEPNQTAIVTVGTSATCKPLGTMVTCDNNVKIK